MTYNDYLEITFWVLSGIIILFSLIPIIRHDHWTFRVFEFPRAQKWVINFLILLSYILVMGISSALDISIVGLLSINLIYLSYQIYPFLPFSPRQVESAREGQEADLTLLISNVYQYNRKFEKLNQLVHENDADLVLMVETDKWWREKSVEGFGEKYPHQVLVDQENTYGMLLFSRLPLENTEVRHLVKKEVPSIVTEVCIENKRNIKLFCIHPEPPIPGENLYSTARDAEILLVGKEAAREVLPVLVAGDLNDVAWSYTTTLFLKVSTLLDPRRGRGFFSTFHAKYPLFQWPLDHVFCSGHFRLKSMKRLRGIGSDHYPILVKFHLSHHEQKSEELPVDTSDIKEADDKINNQ